MQVIEHAFDWLDAPPARVAGLDVPLPYAANLEKLALPQPDWVVTAAKKTVLRDAIRDGYKYSDAGSVADHDGRHAGALAEKGRRPD